MGKIKRYSVVMTVALGAVIIFGNTGSEAAASPTVDTSMRTLTISVGNGENTYGKTTIKVTNKKKFKIKSIAFRSKNAYVAKVSSKGQIVAQSPGETRIVATIKYSSKSKKSTKIKKKTISVPVTVESKYLLDIPQTGMQYDETGKAKPIYPFTHQFDGKGTYSNDASYIDRFPVWVETDYDTDQDGKRDLVMAYVQVPKSATQGYYKAPVIMEANPYVAAVGRSKEEEIKLLSQLKEDSFSYDMLTNSPNPRSPHTEVSTAEVVSGCSVWVNDMESRGYGTGALEDYSYYIIRGYAYVISPGLGGSKDCEGLQCCGERVEAQAHAAVIEWLHGDRNGYSDREGTKLLRADWCNGHTAMTGLSYVGTMAYEVATLGVKGLDTVIPCGAIASWYDYVYSQGSNINSPTDYMSWLSLYSAGRFSYGSKKEEKSDSFFKTYKDLIFKRNYDEVKAEGRYGEYWSRYEYSKAKPTVPALLVEGLNDINVRPIQTLLMRRAFVNAGQECKVIYHQGMHDRLATGSRIWGVESKVVDEYYDDLVNRWLSHYMAGKDNGIDQMKDYTVQSNVDGSWSAYNEGREKEFMEFRSTDGDAESTVKFDIKAILKASGGKVALSKEVQMKDKKMHAVWEKDIDKDVTLSGTVAVHLRVKMPDVNKNAPTMYVSLMDTDDKKFDVFYEESKFSAYAAVDYDWNKTLDVGEGIGSYFEKSFSVKPMKKRMICEGFIDLRMPNAGCEPESCTEPTDPVKNDTYYDYTVYMMPTDYTVKKGHKLKLFIMGFDGADDKNNPFDFVNKYTTPVGYWIKKASKYEFTIDNKSSYAELPIVKE